jgi:hypothetical protein
MVDLVLATVVAADAVLLAHAALGLRGDVADRGRVARRAHVVRRDAVESAAGGAVLVRKSAALALTVEQGGLPVAVMAASRLEAGAGKALAVDAVVVRVARVGRPLRVGLVGIVGARRRGTSQRARTGGRSAYREGDDQRQQNGKAGAAHRYPDFRGHTGVRSGELPAHPAGADTTMHHIRRPRQHVGRKRGIKPRLAHALGDRAQKRSPKLLCRHSRLSISVQACRDG